MSEVVLQVLQLQVQQVVVVLHQCRVIQFPRHPSERVVEVDGRFVVE